MKPFNKENWSKLLKQAHNWLDHMVHPEPSQTDQTISSNTNLRHPQQKRMQALHPLILRLKINKTGRDFVVGDIHACFSALELALEAVKFNPTTDRLISVGDLTNRGPENMRTLEFLNHPWFYSVLGNHDWSHAYDQTPLFESSRINRLNLRWAMPLRNDINYQHMSALLRQLPLMIEIQTSRGLVGVVHGEVPAKFSTWEEAKQSLDLINSTRVCFNNPLLIGRSRQNKLNNPKQTQPIKDLAMAIHGHTPQATPTWIGNSLFIDTGLVYGYKYFNTRKSGLTLIDITNHLAYYTPVHRQKGLLDVNKMTKQPLNKLNRIK